MARENSSGGFRDGVFRVRVFLPPSSLVSISFFLSHSASGDLDHRKVIKKSARLHNPLDCAAQPKSEQVRCQSHFTLTLFQQLTTRKNKGCNCRCATVFVPGAMLCYHGDFLDSDE
ncbi:hypothetical protein T01_11272 [Trichinella spiralis]|uniref:Uncharacterized protein n=1 Tax=Trichinella spiralis TaxID=6334 RepID=A0A0V1BV39_TRISP|nr:hypothetical protein T01_11272 [Trichinella spiralis]